MKSISEYQKVLQAHRICDASKAFILWHNLALTAVEHAGWMALQMMEQNSDFETLLPNGETKIHSMKELAGVAWAKGELEMIVPLTEARGNLLLNKALLFSGEHWTQGGALDMLLQKAENNSIKAVRDIQIEKSDFDTILFAAAQAAWITIRVEWIKGLLYTEDIELCRATIKNVQQEREINWGKWIKALKQQKPSFYEKVEKNEKRIEELKKNMREITAKEVIDIEKISKEIWKMISKTGITKENREITSVFWDSIHKANTEAQEYLKKVKTTATQELQNEIVSLSVMDKQKSSSLIKMR